MAEKLFSHSCVLVTRQSLIFYSPELPDLVTIGLNREILADLEIVNQPALERVIKNWLRQSLFLPKTLTIFFVADTYFFEDVTQVPASTEDPEVVSFVETVPFTDVFTKILPTQSGARIVVINRDLLQPIISAFEKTGFSVLAAAPSFAAGITNDNPFTKEVAKAAISDQNVFTTYNFIESAEVEMKMEAEKSFFSFQLNKKIIAMIAVFVVLIIILVVLIIVQNSGQ